MNDEDILRVLSEVVAEENMTGRTSLDRALTANNIPGWDSMAHVRIMVGLERRLGIQADIDATFGLADFGALIDMVKATQFPCRQKDGER